MNRPAVLVALVLILLAGAASPVSTVSQSAIGPTGAQPFATILCQFADLPAAPEGPEFFEAMLSSAAPGLDHFWREVSYGQISLQGSRVAGWFTMPGPSSDYILAETSDAALGLTLDYTELARDCLAAAVSEIAPDRFAGINLVFNGALDRPRGGRMCLGPDGAGDCHRLTWMWSPGYRHQANWAHEMAHAFGLQHSSVGDGNEYGNLWDLVSQDGPCVVDARLGVVGQHPSAYQKSRLGWIPADRIVDIDRGRSVGLTIEALARLPEAGPLLVRIAIEGSRTHFYTVEARLRIGYDASLPGDAVIIHEVDELNGPSIRPMAANTRPGLTPGGETALAAMWTPGRTFQDPAHGLSVAVEERTADGFRVTVASGPQAVQRLGEPSTPLPASAYPAEVQRALADGSQVMMAGISDAGGDALAIWVETGRQADGVSTVAVAGSSPLYYATRSNAGTWSEPMAVDPDLQAPYYNLTLASDGRGGVYAAWVGSTGGRQNLRWAYRGPVGSWATRAPIALGATHTDGDLLLTVDRNAHAHLTWIGPDLCGAGYAYLGLGD